MRQRSELFVLRWPGLVARFLRRPSPARGVGFLLRRSLRASSSSVRTSLLGDDDLFQPVRLASGLRSPLVMVYDRGLT
jgi:hypothetical protein